MLKDLYMGEKLLLKNVYIADKFTSRLLGYMFQQRPKYKAILFKPCHSIHMFFMKFNLDVIFLDKSNVVVKKVSGLKKNKVIKPVKNACMVIETPEGGFEKVEVGDCISIK